MLDISRGNASSHCTQSKNRAPEDTLFFDLTRVGLEPTNNQNTSSILALEKTLRQRWPEPTAYKSLSPRGLEPPAAKLATETVAGTASSDAKKATETVAEEEQTTETVVEEEEEGTSDATETVSPKEKEGEEEEETTNDNEGQSTTGTATKENFSKGAECSPRGGGIEVTADPSTAADKFTTETVEEEASTVA